MFPIGGHCQLRIFELLTFSHQPGLRGLVPASTQFINDLDIMSHYLMFHQCQDVIQCFSSLPVRVTPMGICYGENTEQYMEVESEDLYVKQASE